MTINLNLDSDQNQIVQSVRDVLADKFPLSRFRAAETGNRDSDALAELAALGWLGLGIEERHGGAGLTLVEEALFFRELGRHLVTPNVLASCLGAHLALAFERNDMAAAIINGSVKLCLGTRLAVPEAIDDVGDHALYDSTGADYVVSWSTSQFGIAPIDKLSSGHPLRCIDKTISLARGSLSGADALSLSGDKATALRTRADLLLAAQLLGIAESALDLAVDYAKLRHQFGRPIGSFQAIKHRCADMKIRVNVLAPLVLMGALSQRDGRSDAELQIASARLLASRYALENAAAGIQIHGAMGFTAECDAHRFLARSHMYENLGSTSTEREIQMASLPAAMAN